MDSVNLCTAPNPASKLSNNEETDLIDIKSYEKTQNNEKYLITLSKSSDKNILYIKSTNNSLLSNTYYLTKLDYESIIKLGKSFKSLDTIEEVYSFLDGILKENKFEIKKDKQDNKSSLNLIFKVFLINGKEEQIEIKLSEKKSSNEILKEDLITKVNQLELENRAQNEEIKSLKQRLTSLEEWKKKYEDELNTLVKTKKEKEGLDKIESSILSSIKELNLIENRLKKNPFLKNKNIKYKLIYKASRDGDSIQKFHEKCDNIPYTLSLVKTQKGSRFGGYTEQKWDRSNKNKKDSQAFVFNLDIMKIYNPQNNCYSIGCFISEGLYFYCGDDLFRVRDFHGESDCTYTKDCTNYGKFDIDYEITNGENIFQTKEIETYEVIYD